MNPGKISKTEKYLNRHRARFGGKSVMDFAQKSRSVTVPKIGIYYCSARHIFPHIARHSRHHYIARHSICRYTFIFMDSTVTSQALCFDFPAIALCYGPKNSRIRVNDLDWAQLKIFYRTKRPRHESLDRIHRDDHCEIQLPNSRNKLTPVERFSHKPQVRYQVNP